MTIEQTWTTISWSIFSYQFVLVLCRAIVWRGCCPSTLTACNGEGIKAWPSVPNRRLRGHPPQFFFPVLIWCNVAFSGIQAMYTIPPFSPTGYSSRCKKQGSCIRKRFLATMTFFSWTGTVRIVSYHSTQEGHCWRKTFWCTNSFGRSLDWPVGEDGGSLYIVFTPKT